MGYGTRELDYETTIDDVKSIHFGIGKKVRVKTKVDKTSLDFEGTVVGDYPFFFNVDTGNYVMSINKVDMLYRYGGVAVKEVG